MSPTEYKWPQPHELSLGGNSKFILPRLSDPRYLIWFFQLVFFVIGVTVGAFSKSFDALAVSLVTAGLLDFAITWYRQRKLILPQSGLIAGTGIALLLEANQLWYYALGGALAILSKHLVQHEGRHTYNPSGLGALAVVSMFPYAVISNVSQWGGLTWFTIFIWITGFVTGVYSRVLSTALLWMAWFAVFALFRAAYLHAPPMVPLGTMTGPSFALFSFFMITDPRTTPNSVFERGVFCFLAAAVDAFLRLQENPYASFWGLIAAPLVYPFLEPAISRIVASRKIPMAAVAGRIPPA